MECLALSLFRQESIDAQRHSFMGRVSVQTPVSFLVLTIVLSFCAATLLIFASLAQFSRKETVGGRLVPTSGLSGLVATQSGVVTKIRVETGDTVLANQVILAINSGAETERAKVSDFSANGIRNRIAEIETQLVAISSRSELERRRLDQQAQALLREAGTLNESLVLQKKQIALAQSQVDRVRPLVENGYISLIERDRRVQTVLSLQQGVSDLERQIELRRSSARDYLAQAVQVEETSRADIAQVRGSKLTLEQSLIEAEAQGASILRAPISGEIASLDIHTGEFVAAGTTVATIVAPGDLLAELLVPTSAAGFVKPGQPVRIMVDAFPFQRFGALNGRIARVSRAPVPEVAKQGATQTPAYKIIVAVDRSSLKAYGALADIKPGMRVTADLVTGRATILQQLFDPLLSAGMRL